MNDTTIYGQDDSLIGNVYFIRGGDFVKIGFSTRPVERIKALQQASPLKLKFLAIIPDVPFSLERHFHYIFSDSHSHYEWYYLSMEIRLFLEWLNDQKEVGGEDFPHYLQMQGWR